MLSTIVMAALGTLAVLTVVNVQGGMQSSTTERFHQIAVYAAESGGAAGMEYLRANLDLSTGWSSLISANNATVQAPTGITGNDVATGATGNPFSTDQQASYKVEIYNNRNDTGYAAGQDQDKRVILRVTGRGPNGAVAILEWEVASGTSGTSGTPCSTYGQEAISENGGGAANCVGNVTNTNTGTMRPGG